jgi:hypothetical protein
MTFDLAQIITTCIIWFIIGGLVVGFIVWAVMTNNTAFLDWLRFHLPWLFALLHTGVVCPTGYSCSLTQ